MKHKQSKIPIFLAGLMGVSVGAFLVSYESPTFLTQPKEASVQMMHTTQENVQPVTSEKVITTDVTKAIQKASDAVVGVINTGNTDSQTGTPIMSTGSGIIYKKEGKDAYVITNNHVIASAKKLEVSLSDGTRLPATLLGADVVTDLAVLKINSKNVKDIAVLGDSTHLLKGQPVVAIGNPLGLDFSGTATEGIISATKRTIPINLDNSGHYDWQVEVIQTDAAINPGNSGGPLIDINGDVIGINSMKITEQSVEGIGFAIPISAAKPIIAQIEKYGKVNRPYMGIEIKSLSELPTPVLQSLHLPPNVTQGICITSIISGTSANSTGLQKNDVIIEMDNTPIIDTTQFRETLYAHYIGEKVTLKIYRDGELKTLTLTLSEDKH